MDKNREKIEGKQKNSEFDEKVLDIARVSRVVKGGRRMRFRALVVIGNRNGKIGYGLAKAGEISVAVKKAVTRAKKQLIVVPIINGTIPYQVYTELGSAKVFLKPAKEGTSIVAGGVVRAIAELAGIKNLVSKVMGTPNKTNNTAATFQALSNFDQGIVKKLEDRAKNRAEKKPQADNVNIIQNKSLDKKAKNETPRTEKVK
ncbi:MAG: small subunit ribosomal protein S5 [Candidatus Berkelbacteria bacterium Athens1014_28]|uniref:Small ribosomal subunit protein uS5 n=1 Tax=Candidatus Berkelbacteria bacterium Athens1014_28 TaxID=2017145 RepID=A0A554LQZ4_9BACT|nr:MAG: small subunit ribosomal protein S5 [Candidatus Berkelbacteria bacterium Athens1014_28]